MVLFKRKPVRFIEPPPVYDVNTEVWVIPQTGELFGTYDEYLTRMDFYKQRRFICQITGHSGLNFFEALKSELAGAEEVDQAFPEALKGPILRRVQFQTVSRIDHLVDQVYEEFKNDYYPGECVGVQLAEGDRHQGVVREKTRFGSKVRPDGTHTEPYSIYVVSMDKEPGSEAQVDGDHIWRDRKVFTKVVLRSFIKKTVTREAWNGAPWLVKHDVAANYHIDTRVPAHLLYDNKLLERKQLLAQKKMQNPDESMNGRNGLPPANGMNGPLGTNPFSANGPMRLPELKPAPKSHKAKHPNGNQPHAGKGKQNGFNFDHSQDQVHPMPGNPFQFPGSLSGQAPAAPVYHPDPPPPPPPPPKYPIEDLQLESRGTVRPPLKYLCSDPLVHGEEMSALGNGKILMKSVGPLLETWDTLNVYCEVFKLDSFTFDDYVEALAIMSEEIRPQLFDEIHCAVLSILVSSAKDGGKPQILLPDLDDEEEEDASESAAESPEPAPEPAKRATRSSLAKAEAERLANEAAAAERELEEESAIRHRATDVLVDFNWIEQASKRQFQNGGWERIMVGLLHQLSKSERHRLACEELLSHLVPTNVEPTQETVRQHYASLDINLRVTALQIICMLTVETKSVRWYMDECSETMTEYRKNKIEFQRQRKQAIEDLKVLNEERKALLPENMPPPEPQNDADKPNGAEVTMSDAVDHPSPAAEDETLNADTTEDDVPNSRALRRAQDRQQKREETRKKEAAAAKAPKQSKQFIKLLKNIEKKEEEIKHCEAEVAIIDNDLREADCPRTRVLGKDRFWNRYYWFERNGMPYAGLPNSSTASAAYANGCIWVQGPDDMEREGYIDLPEDQQAEYKAKFGSSVPERKAKEEGTTHVYNARQWGYIADPEHVRPLIDWLDQRGINEVKLRKELVTYQTRIETHMRNRLKYLEDKEDEKTEEAPVALTKGNGRRPSRRSAVVQATPEPPAYRCLRWENRMAMDELGHTHSNPPPPPKKPARKSNNVAVAVDKKPPKRSTRNNS